MFMRKYSLSCGCLHKEVVTDHGNSKYIEYRLWQNIHLRCYKKTNNRYHSHGARGIKVCERWHDFENFHADMGDRPSPKHTVERINNDGNYEPSNCKWATYKVQSRNRRSTFYVALDGVKKSLAEWAEIMDMPYKLVWERIRRYGWDPEQALTTPVRR